MAFLVASFKVIKALNKPTMNNNYIGVDLDLFRQPKIQRLELKLGAESLTIFLKLYLKNAEQEHLKLEDLKLYAREFYCSLEMLEKVLSFKDLFVFEQDKFYVEMVKIKLDLILEKREKLSNAGKAGNAKRWARQSPPDSHPIATQSQVKESKVKEIKEKESIVDNDNQNFEMFKAYPDFLKNKETLFPNLTENQIEVLFTNYTRDYPTSKKTGIYNYLAEQNKKLKPYESKFNQALVNNEPTLQEKFKNATITL